MKLVEGVADIGDVDSFVGAVGDIGAEHGCAIQVFDAGFVADRAHLRAAAARANRAVERDENVADDRAVEILLYAAGRRQIREAMAMGVNEGETAVVAVVEDGSLRPGERGSVSSAERAAADDVRDLLDPADTLGTADADRLAAFFDVSAAERGATDASLAALVRERVALLDVEK